MIKALKLNHRTFPVNIVQGPLAGISCAPFRALTSKYTPPAFSCTEMLSCKTLITQYKFACQRFLIKHPEEGPLCLQLSASDPFELVQATKIASDHNIDLIDLNCGCPVKKIRSKGAGSSLLSDASRLYKLIYAMKQNTHLPVSIKIRVDGNSSEQNNAEIVKVVRDAGVDFLIVHGRHWSERYETPCHYEQIKFFSNALNIPVIGNGDIACIHSLKKMFATGCAGVMISRAGVGQPWLIKKLIAQMTGQAFSSPNSQEMSSLFMVHIQQLCDLLDNERFAVLQARKLSKYYARNLSTKAEFCKAINVCENLQDLRAICTMHFC